jgi:hypothetical protein
MRLAGKVGRCTVALGMLLADVGGHLHACRAVQWMQHRTAAKDAEKHRAWTTRVTGT